MRRAVRATGAISALLSALVVARVGSDSTQAVLAAAAQTAGVMWLAGIGWSARYHWATITTVVAGAWVLLFVIPSWIYALDPTLLRGASSPNSAIAIVTLALFATILGRHASSAAHDVPAERGPQPPFVVRRRTAVAFVAFATASLALLLALNGGPSSYYSDLGGSAEANAGLTYIFWGVLFAKFAALAMLVVDLGNGPVQRSTWLVAGCALALLLALGSRGPLAIALVQVLLVVAWTRRPARATTVVVGAVLASLILIFGYGGLKRYQAYADAGGSRSVTEYLIEVVPDEAATAYVDNYVDTVRLTAVAASVVPGQEPYEYGKEALRAVLQPIPGPFRPDVAQTPALAAALDPGQGFAYAVPLAASSYLQLGGVGVLAVFACVGVLMGFADRRLEMGGTPTLTLVLAGIAVAVPMTLRAGATDGFALGAIEVIGLGFTGWVLCRPARRSQASNAETEQARHEVAVPSRPS